MSHRYGMREVPNLINEQEFESLKESLQNKNFDCSFELKTTNINVDIKNLIEECYRLDENEVPRKYKLLNIDEILHGYSNVCSNLAVAYYEKHFLLK